MKLLTVFIGSFLIGYMSPEFSAASKDSTPTTKTIQAKKTEPKSFYQEEVERLYEMAEAFTKQNQKTQVLAKSALNGHFH